MANIFEQLMGQNRSLTESVAPRKSSKKVTEGTKKICCSKIKVESLRILESEDFDELDAQFAVDPEESEESEVVLVIDPEIPADGEVPENAAEEMVGDEIYKCSVCGANYVCDCDAEMNENIEVDEEGHPIECPICGDDADQILVGEIAPVEDAGDPDSLDPVDSEDIPEDEGEGEEGSEDESLEESLFENDSQYIWTDWRKTPEGMTRTFVPKDRKLRKISEVGTVYAPNGDDFDKYGADIVNSTKTDILASEDNNFDTEEDAMKWVEDWFANSGKTESLRKEDLDPVEGSLELEIPTEDPEDAPAVEINADVVNLSLDDGRFESLMTKMIRENYKFNPTFKITKVSARGSQLKVEYVVRESSKKKTTSGVMVAEGFNRKSRAMTLKFRDKGAFTESFGRTPSFIIECVRIRNKVIPTCLGYDFTKRVNESLYRISGRVDSKKRSNQSSLRWR